MRGISLSDLLVVVAVLQVLLRVGRDPLLGQHMQELLIDIPIMLQSHMITKFRAKLCTLRSLVQLLLTMVVI